MQSLYPKLSILLYKLPDGTLFTSLHTVCVRLVGGFLILIGVSLLPLPSPTPHQNFPYGLIFQGDMCFISRKDVFFLCPPELTPCL